MVSLVKGRDVENIEKRRRYTEKKTLKNEEKEKQTKQGKSHNNDLNLWFYPFNKSCLAQNYSLKKVLYTIAFYLRICITQ